MNLHLFLHNAAFLAGAIVSAVMIILVCFYSIQKRKYTGTVTTFILMNLAVIVLQISQVLGVNATDAVSSRNYFMFNLTNFFIQIFMTHWFLATIGKVRKRIYILAVIYISAIVGFVFFTIFPDLFLLDSVPKLYLPYFYNPGPLYILVPTWFFIVGAYYFTELVVAYRKEADPIQKNRLKYIFLAIFYGFIVGTSDFLLVFNIPFDPFLSGLFGLYTIPLAYAIIQYELLDIRILAKRTFFFTLIVGTLSIGIALVNLLGDYIVSLQPEIPKAIFYVLSSFVAAAGGFYAWRRVRQVDIMKYQFINVITHTFRTPLTEIKWAAEILGEELGKLSENGQNAVRTIRAGNSRLVELTNTLVALNDSEARSYVYVVKDFLLGVLAKSVVDEYVGYFPYRHLTFTFKDEAPGTYVRADEQKMKFVLRIGMENAIRYSNEGGSISVLISDAKSKLRITIRDTGIGIPANEASLIFTKFYRAKNAQRSDTDGSGVSLYLASEIVSRSGGNIDVSSNGEGMGTTLTILLPKSLFII